MLQSCSATGLGVSESHGTPRACITMTRKVAKVVTEEIAVILLVLFTVVILKNRKQCKNVKSRFHVFRIYMAAVTLFRFCRAYGLKLRDLMVVCYPKTIDTIHRTLE